MTFIAEIGATFWACGRTEGAISSPSTTWPPYLICQVCFDQHHCWYVNIILQLQCMLMLCSQVIPSHKGWRSKGGRYGLHIWASESTTTLPSLSDCVISRWSHEALKKRPRLWFHQKISARYCCLCHQRHWNLPHLGCPAYGLRKVITYACDWTPHASWWIFTKIFNCSILTKIFLKRFHSPCNQPFDYNRPAVNQRLQPLWDWCLGS